MQRISPSKSTQNDVPNAPEHARCAYRGPTGRQCRNILTAWADNIFCPIHIAKIERDQRAERQSVVNDLFADLEDLNSSFTIRRFLKRLMPMVVHRRLTRGEAYLLSYISSLLLQSLESANHEIYVATDHDDSALDLAIRRSLQPFLVETLGYDPIPAVNRQIADRKSVQRPRPPLPSPQPKLVTPAPREIRTPDSHERDWSSFPGDSKPNSPDSPNPRAS